MTPRSDDRHASSPVTAPAGLVLPFPVAGITGGSGATSPYYGAEGALALKAAPQPDGLLAPNGVSAERSAAIVARALLEVLSGWRPASQLTRWTSHSLQQDLERRAPRRPIARRQRLIKLRISAQAPGIAEICAISHDPGRGRIRVIAFRLEAREAGWIVTRLQAG